METYIVKKKEGKLFLFKKDQEIGQVSLDATWVKEGDEFDGKDLRFYTDTIEEKDYISVKGPCGHFH